MYFLTDNINKVIFGWSAKCGCSHIKKIFYYLTMNIFEDNLHIDYSGIKLLSEEYKIFIFIRNPYERIISGFIHKYNDNGSYRKLWDNNIPLTFNNFVNELITDNYKMVEEHHFTPQLSEKWDDSLYNHKNLKIYDINNIDYVYIEKLYNKKIPEILINFKGGHENKKELFDYPKNIVIYNILQKDYIDKKPLTKNFYNEDIKNKILSFYKKDFEYFNSIGYKYDIEL
jgi:hypothetical protein